MDTPPGNVMGRLRAARERLDAKDTAGAVALYEEVLAAAGERADVLVTISGDLGSTGHVHEIVELIAPRYDARRHGPATGFNLLQAYIARRDPEAAQHILDLLFELKRPELEERLYGFSNAIADLLLAQASGANAEASEDDYSPPAGPAGTPPVKIGIVTLSKPVWYYGLEPLAAEVLPPKDGKPRRVAFAQLTLPASGGPDADALRRPDSELGLLSLAIPSWFAEVFAFAPAYAPLAAVTFMERPDGSRHPVIFPTEWTTDNLRQLVDTSGGLDYIFTGVLRQSAGDYALTLRLWEVKKFRERKVFTATWTPATADAELEKLRAALCHFMEWGPYPTGVGLAYAPPAAVRAWLEVVGASTQTFLADKKIVPPATVGPLEPATRALQQLAPRSVPASLAWITLKQRAGALGLPLGTPEPELMASSPVVRAAQAAV